MSRERGWALGLGNARLQEARGAAAAAGGRNDGARCSGPHFEVEERDWRKSPANGWAFVPSPDGRAQDRSSIALAHFAERRSASRRGAAEFRGARAAARAWQALAAIALLSCGGEPPAAGEAGAPAFTGGASVRPPSGPASGGESAAGEGQRASGAPSAAPASGEGGEPASEGAAGEGIDLVEGPAAEAGDPGSDPAASASEPGDDAEGEGGGEEPGMDSAPALEPIAAPGYPAGSAPRLVPLQFAGPLTGRPVLFNIYLPPGYDSSGADYPVLYDLHGLTDSRDTNPGPVIRSLEGAMRAGQIGPLIVVFPQSFSEGYYADSFDGARPGETQLIDELVPYVDATFRTLPHRARRGISGFSMGGFGALAFATKYPDRFSIGIGYDSALDTWETLVGRRAYIASAAFGDDESRFDAISPWAHAERNAERLAESSTLRLAAGNQYRQFNEDFRDHLARLGIPLEHVQTSCDHVYSCLIDSAGARSWSLLQAEFSRPATVER